MHALFLACLVGGLAATALFALLGALGGAAGHGAGHLHAGSSHAGHLPAPSTPHAHALPAQGAHGHAATGHTTAQGHATAGAAPQGTLPTWLSASAGWTLSWLSPLTLAAGALWFGGAGLVAENTLPRGLGVLILVLAVLGALLGAAVVRALMAALLRAGTPPLSGDAIGAVGTLSAPIRVDGPGEVIYTLEGLHRSAAARSVDGRPLPRGANVVIVRRERGIAWVEPLDPLATLGHAAETMTGTTIPARHGDLIPPP